MLTSILNQRKAEIAIINNNRNQIVFAKSFIQWREHSSINILYRTSWIKISKVHWVFCMFSQELGQRIATVL